MTAERRHPSHVVAVGLLAAVIVPIGGARPAGADPPTTQFDYSMPDRFGPDRNGDGLIDYVDGATDQSPTGYDPTPSSWRVDLDACANGASDDAMYAWRVVDQPAPAAPITVQVTPQGDPGTCDDFYMVVPEEGTYRVELQVTDGVEVSTIVRKEVVVQDWLIVSVGDSYGSGEGSPDVQIDQTALAEAEGAWTAVAAEWNELVTIRTSMESVNASIAMWQQAVAALTYCDVSAPWADAGLCAQALADVTWWSAIVVGALAVYAAGAVIETVEDAVDLVNTVIVNQEQLLSSAIQVANSVSGALSATWQEDQCHRSAKAGSALAAKQIEDEDPRTSVTFIHLACSGATMVYGLLGYYEGAEAADDPYSADPAVKLTNEKCDEDLPAPGGKPAGWVRPAGCVRPQVDVAEELVGSREVDAFYVSIGGNDAHFGDIVIACILLEPCDEDSAATENPGEVAANVYCPQLSQVPLLASIINFSAAQCDALLRPIDFDPADDLIYEGVHGDVRPPIDKRFPGLSVGYGWLDDKLTGVTDGPGLIDPADTERVFLSEYVDAVKDDVGAPCDYDTMGFASIPGLSAYESGFIDTGIIPPLKSAIQQATIDNGWTFVDGIYAGFTNHGYCAVNHYIVRMEEAFLIEGRYNGMVHPNYSGHQVYRQAIYNQIQPSLYPTGVVTQPRRPDQKPFADAAGPWTVTEGSSVTLVNDSWDSDADSMTFAWSHDQPGKASFSSATASQPSLQGIDDAATGTMTIAVSDEDGSRSDTSSFTVLNAVPQVGLITGLDAPVLLNTAKSVAATFTDAGVADTHTVTWDWGDGTTSPGTVTEASGSGTASGQHTYTATGIYTVTATVTDDDGGSDTQTHQYAVVYDAAGGFVTGAGWFESPSGAYTPGVPGDADIVGKAHFGFVSKYQKGATTPQGNTAFRFQAADLQFDSTSYDWMVIAGSKATYKGIGQVNGVDGYAFIISAVDGGAAGADKLRVKIWDKTTEVVLYDNQSGTAVEGTPATEIGAGAITVRGPK